MHASCPRVRTASACRTNHAFVTLPPLLTSARRREDAGASPGSLSSLQASSSSVKPTGPRPNGIAAMVRERIDLARKPLTLRGSLFDCVASEWTKEEKLEKLVPNPPKVTVRKVIAHETKAPALV